MKAYLVRLYLITFLILLISPQLSQATHVYGGSIYYACQNACTYTVFVETSFDCYSAITQLPSSPPPPIVGFIGNGGSCSQPTPLTAWVLDSYVDVTPICPTDSTQCTSPNAVVGGSLVAIYRRDYDFCGAGSCPSYVARWTTCCRSGSITSGAANTNIYLETEIDLSISPCNHAPVFAFPPITHICAGTGSIFSQAAIDEDGDSLAYSLVACNTASNTPVNYMPGFSASNPMGSTWQVNVDTHTGELSILPNPGTSMLNTICMQVDEYRNGAHIGSVTREMMVLVMNCPAANSLPQVDSVRLSGGGAVRGTNGFYTCLGDSLEVLLYVSDSDMAQSLDVVLPLHIHGLSRTLVGSNPAMIQLRFRPQQAGLFSIPLLVRDDACPLVGSVVQMLSVEVDSSCYPPVHPGDANFDQIANNIDLLALGLNYGRQGHARLNASSQWQPQAALNWWDTLANGADIKHSDCNGDGVIDSFDVAPILMNYGSTHTFSKTAAAGAPLFMIPPATTFTSGDTVRIPLHWGDMADPLTDAYGLAFSVTYDSSRVEKAWMEFQPSWLATPGTDLIALDKDLPNLERIEVGISRNDQMFRAGYGHIADLIIVMDDDLNKRLLPMTLGLENAYAINNLEEEIPVETQDAQINLQTTVDPGLHARISLFPNPTKDKLYMDGIRLNELQAARLYDVHGRTISFPIIEQQGQFVFDLSHLHEGFYLLEIQTATGKATFKVIKQP
jgi:hypothetical protein